jgi:hypothetical protein
MIGFSGSAKSRPNPGGAFRLYELSKNSPVFMIFL